MTAPRTNSRWFAVLISVLTALLACAPVRAQDKTAEIDKLFDWATQETPGCTIAVSLNGKVIVNRSYGSADLERSVPVSPDSIFDAGSVTKQFVAAATLILVEEGRLSLSEDIRKYLPELPDTGHKITLDHLMTHTSGVRDWTGILPLAAGDPDALTVVLRQRGLNFAPGDELSYSNSGYVLLKEIVGRVSGVPFPEFAQKRLFEPLGMKSTQYLGDLREVVKNRALAYKKDRGRWRMDMKLDNTRGGGGALFSTPGDLLVWNEALTSGRLGAFVTAKLQEPTKLNNGRQIDVCRGLFLGTYRGAKEVWHSGGAGGYSTWLGRYPEHGLSIAIMCNADDAGTTSLAHRIFDLFVPDAGAAESESGPPPAIADAELPDVNGKAGLFYSERTGEPMRLVVDRGRFRIGGGPGLVPVSKDRFRRWGVSLQFMPQDKFEVHFVSQNQFELKSMDGGATRYRRAKPFAPTADELKAFAGRFESDEIGAVFVVKPKGDGLIVSLEHSQENGLEFKPADPDKFQANNVMVCFVRDETGKVVALDYRNPVINSIRCTRLADRTPSRSR